MAEFPYSMSIGRMQEFLRSIPSMGVPEKVVLKTLEARGFKSTNDRTILPALRFLGLTDASGTPTAAWQALRNRENYGKVMASLVRDAYADLFNTFEDAHIRSDKDIKNYISTHSKSDDRMVASMVGVFKMLCSLSDFDATPAAPEEAAPPRPSTDQLSRGTNRLSVPVAAPSEVGGLTLNFHLHLAEDASAEQIDNVLKGVAKYLMGREVD